MSIYEHVCSESQPQTDLTLIIVILLLLYCQISIVSMNRFSGHPEEEMFSSLKSCSINTLKIIAAQLPATQQI